MRKMKVDHVPKERTCFSAEENKEYKE